MHNADTKCTMWGESGPKGRENSFMFKFLLSCHKNEFYFIIYETNCTSYLYVLDWDVIN